MIHSFTPLEQSVVFKAREQVAASEKNAPLALLTKVARNTFADQAHSYTVELADFEVKLFMNLRKCEEGAIAGSGEFKVSKIMKRVGTDEVAVRSVLKHAKNGITTEALVFARIKEGEGSGKQYVLHGNVFAFTRKNGEAAVACVSPYCPSKFNDLTKEQKKAAMRAIAQGIEYLHANGIVHCDIHDKNILMNEKGPVIIDLEGALLFGQDGALDAEFSKRRIQRCPCFLKESAPPDIRKAVGATFDALTFGRAKKWDIFAFGLLVNDAYNLGIAVESTNIPLKLTKQGYSDSIDEIPDCDYEVYKAPAEVPDHEKAIVSVALKCLQGHTITWPEIISCLL